MYDKEVRNSQIIGVEKSLYKHNEQIIEMDREQNRFNNKMA